MGYFFRVCETVKSVVKDIEKIPIIPGQYLICTDTGDLYYDNADSKRQHLTDIIDLETDAERTAILVPIDKTYFVKSTCHFWRYLSGAWVDLSAATAGGSSQAVFVTLQANEWVAGRQTVSVPGMTKNQNGNVGLIHDVTTAQFEAASNANLYPCHQEDGELTIAVYGDTPTVDIPAVVILLS